MNDMTTLPEVGGGKRHLGLEDENLVRANYNIDRSSPC